METFAKVCLGLISLFVFWVIVVVLWAALGVGHASAHSEGMECFLASKDGQKFAVKKLSEEVLENGLVAESYDLTRDDKLDLMTFSHQDGTKDGHKRYPVFYMIDLDQDGNPDVIFVDRKGDGQCSSIEVYEDLRVPHDAGANFQHDAMKEGRDI